MRLMGTAELSAFTGFSLDKIRDDIQRGDVPVHVVGPTFVFVESEIIEAIESGRWGRRKTGRPKGSVTGGRL